MTNTPSSSSVVVVVLHSGMMMMVVLERLLSSSSSSSSPPPKAFSFSLVFSSPFFLFTLNPNWNKTLNNKYFNIFKIKKEGHFLSSIKKDYARVALTLLYATQRERER